MTALDPWERRALRHLRALRRATWDRDADGIRRQMRGLFEVAMEDAVPPADVVEDHQSRPAAPDRGEAARSGAPPQTRPPCHRSHEGG